LKFFIVLFAKIDSWGFLLINKKEPVIIHLLNVDTFFFILVAKIKYIYVMTKQKDNKIL